MSKKLAQVKRAEGGFTLVELMIVVVIIGILAAIAIPQFQKFQLRSKHGEAGGVMVAMAKSNDQFSSKWAHYAVWTEQPNVAGFNATGDRAGWDTCPAAGAAGATIGNCLVGYTPTGRTYFRYGILAETGPGDCIGGNYNTDAWGNQGTVNSVMGTLSGFPCFDDSSCGGSVANAFDATSDLKDVLYMANADVDGDGTDGTYTSCDEQQEANPEPDSYGESIF